MRPLLLAALLACTAGAGCGGGETLEAIRERQARGDHEGSIAPLRELLLERPDDPEANYRYGRALAETGGGGIATFALRKAMRSPEWQIPAALQLAQSALATADYNEAAEAASFVLERDPQNVPALLARAEAHAYWRKQPELALADADRVLEIDPDAIQAFEPRILALLWLDRIDEATAAMEELGRRIEEVESPEMTRAWYCGTAAVFAQEKGELAKARETWESCLAKYPASPDVVWAAMQFYDALEDPERSIQALRDALAAEPRTLIYRAALADRLRQQGRAGEGEEILAVATRDEDPEIASGAWLAIGKLRQAAGDRKSAPDAIAHAVDTAREAGQLTPQLSFEYADALVLAERFDDALEAADGLTVAAHRHLIRARVAQERGDPALALREYDEGLRLWPDNPWARYYAARAAEDHGDFERALEEYRNSIRIDPGATDARTRAARLLIAEGKRQFASALLRELDHKPLDAAGELLALRLAGRFGTPKEIDAALARIESSDFTLTAVAVTEIAHGVAEGKSGPRGALALLRRAPGLDLRSPRDAVALRELVRYSHAVGDPATPRELRAALAANPDSADIQAIRGLDLELSGKARDGARAAYTRALELDPNQSIALIGLGRLTAESDPENAVALFDRAAAADPDDPEPKLAAARTLLAAGRADPAAERLDALLRVHPLAADAAALRAEIDLDRGLATDRTLERARRAARFARGPEALELLARVHSERGDAAQAEKAAKRANAMREKTSS